MHERESALGMRDGKCRHVGAVARQISAENEERKEDQMDNGTQKCSLQGMVQVREEPELTV